MQGVPCDLRAVLRVVDGWAQHRGHGVGALPGTAFWIAAQHVHHEEVHQSVTVDVSDIHGHGAETLVSEECSWSCLKTRAGPIEPDAVFPVDKVVAHVEVGPAIAIEVTEHGAEAPVGRRRSEFLTILIKECALGPRDRSKVSSALIEVEEIPLPALQDFCAAIPFAHRDKAILRRHPDRPIGFPSRLDSQTRRLVFEGGGPVVGDVEVEITIPIDVGQRQRGSSQALGESVLVGFSEVSGPVVQE